MKHLSFGLLVFGLLFSLSSFAQKSKGKTTKTTTTTTTSTPSTVSNSLDLGMYKSLRWRNIGPFRGGRSNTVVGVPGKDHVYYCGYTGGGIWKTEDSGLSWRNISDGQFKTSSVGDLAIANSDPNTIYAGMGEHAVRGVMTTYGDGVYKSTDGGQTWKNMGLEKTRHISDVVIHPQNADVVYVAAQGPLHGPSPDRGIYRSTDGGKTWAKILYVDENTGASSLSMDVNNPRILYAATWEHRRLPWKVESGGPGCAIYKSTDGGETWSKLKDGLPEKMGKIGVSVSPANSNRVYAIVETEKSKSGLYRSDDGGKKWTMLSTDQTISSRSWYYMEVFADPVNADIVYVLNAPMCKSIDGGKTFSTIRVGHGDTHDLWINPSNNQNIILGDDGGGEITFNGGRSWSPQGNQPTAQFYRVNTDNLFPYRVYGGQQDNTSVVIASRTNGFGITANDWFVGPGCESGYIAFDPNNPEIMFGGCYQGLIEALDTRTNETKDIMAYPSLSLANPPKRLKYRFNWNAPIIASVHDPKVMYHAGNVLFKTNNGGLSWQAISDDLTRNDTTRQEQGGGPFTNEGAGGENYNTIYYVAESSLEKGVIYTGSDCGLVFLTRDEGKSWTNVTPPGLQECMIHSIEVSPHDAGTAYVSASRYKFNDYGAYSYKTTDYGKTWTLIAKGIDADDFLKVVREDKKTKGLLYAGAERGFYLSFDGGMNWQRWQSNLPIVPITDLKIQDNDLVASTAGRAFWILDDLTALQQGGSGKYSGLKILMPKNTIRASSGGSFAPEGGIPGLGSNPADGVALDFYLPSKAGKDSVLTLEILNMAGKVLRKYSSQKDENFKPFPGGPPAPRQLPAEKGLNRFNWDFRTETLTPVQGVFVYGDYRGQRVPPGNYKAKLSFLGQTSETDFKVIADPRTKINDADWSEQQTLLQQTADRIHDMHTAVNTLRKVRKQIEAQAEAYKDLKEAEALLKLGKDLVKKITAWEANIVETRTQNGQDVINWPSKLSSEFFDLRGKLDTHDPRVTQGVRDRLRDLEAEWAKHKVDLKQLTDVDLAAYNQQFKSSNIPALSIGN
jgi:photosystem II stability/assembly factor-like uncharacterized protein